MLGKHKLGACLPTFGSCADRYCLSGYGRGETTMEGMLEAARTVEGLDGLEIVGNWHVNDANVRNVARMFRDAGMAVSMVVPDLWTQAKWGRGSLAAPDEVTRRAAVDEVRKCMDWAAEIGCAYVDVWPGQDGYDYSFQGDFSSAWKWLRDGVAVCAEHRGDVKVLVEYKLKEPRTHLYVSSAAKTILLLQGLKNVGCLIDVGHSLAAKENAAEAVALLAQYGMLDYVHLNDNYRSWDDDMIVASVHVVEYLELAHWLDRVGYQGWLTLDIFPYREKKVDSARESFEWIRTLFDRVRGRSDAIREVIQRAEGTEAVRLARELLTGRP